VPSPQSLARACSRRPWLTIAAWIGAIVLALACTILLLPGNLTSNGHVTGNPPSRQAERLFYSHFPPDRTAADELVVVRSQTLTVRDPAFRSFVASLMREGARTGVVYRARSYYTTHAASLVSPDGHATLITILRSGNVDPLLPIVRANDGRNGFRVNITGSGTLDHDFNELSQHDLKSGELRIGLPFALIVLVLVFGAVVAGLVPLLMAMISIVVALGLTSIVASGFTLSIFVINMLTGMGLALGIDYSLFVVSRYREERGRGLKELDAIEAAGGTASRAVLFSGSVFVIALTGMLLVPSNVMRSLAVGAILVGIVSVAAALTLLPALLGLLGDRVNALRIPWLGRNIGQAEAQEGRFWGAIVHAVMRRPAIYLAGATALLLLIASPLLGLNLGASGVSTLPDRLASKRGYEALAASFPSASASPALVVAQGSNDAASLQRSLLRLRADAAHQPAFGLGEVRVAGPDLAALVLPVRGDRTGQRALDGIRYLRSTLIPRAFAGVDAKVVVGGDTADNVDFIDAVHRWLPFVFAFVLGLSFVLLTFVFRSIVVALTSIALNLLSVGAAYGLLTLVFQHGVATSILGFQHVPIIEAWVPLFLFSVLFGLSMDYQVFLLTRIKEHYDLTGSTSEAVAYGVGSTARLITGAALIIVAVFTGFAMGDLVMFQQMGFGVAVALLIDATVIRSVLLPAAMQLLGRWNWYLPRWLEWLPEVQVESAERPVPAVSA
jgi:RND superfamily putative drug exporter